MLDFHVSIRFNFAQCLPSLKSLNCCKCMKSDSVDDLPAVRELKTQSLPSIPSSPVLAIKPRLVRSNAIRDFREVFPKN